MTETVTTTTYLASTLTMASIALDRQRAAVADEDYTLAWHAGMHHQNAGAVAALLVVLHQLSPVVADQLAARLLTMQEAGQQLGEQWLEWRQQLADGRPLTPFATEDEITALRGGGQ